MCFYRLWPHGKDASLLTIESWSDYLSSWKFSEITQTRDFNGTSEKWLRKRIFVLSAWKSKA